MARKFYTENGESIPAIKYVNSAPIGYTLITDENQLIRLYTGQYEQRATDGQNYFNSFRSKLMIDVVNAVYTIQEVFALEMHLELLAVSLTSGNWLSSQALNQSYSLSGLYTQIMKDEIKATLDAYILDNY